MSRSLRTELAAEPAFFGIAALLFAGGAAITIVRGVSMSAAGGMAMAGDWTMSMAWMRMPGESWIGAAASFLGMWVAMMLAMMLPSLLPMLRGYQAAIDGAGAPRRGTLTTLVGLGYFAVWSALGVAIFPVGVALASAAMRWPMVARDVPFAVAAVVVIAGLTQFTGWKSQRLSCCREAPRSGSPWRADGLTAWRYGVRLGRECSACCAGLTAILLVIGVMDLRAMAIVTVAISAERFAPAGEHIARVIGSIMIAAGVFLLARAAGI